MLNELRVQNLLLIEAAELRLAAGLNALTGETGAGKTMLAHALDLLLGGRPRAGIVRPGAAEAYVEGAFELPDGGSLPAGLRERLPADAGEIVLARRVGADGRSRGYINGRTATVSDLRDLGAVLVSYYGQHEHRKLTISSSQLALLDGRCGGDHADRLRACADAFERTRVLGGRLQAAAELTRARGGERMLLEHELAEIDEASIEPGEHERLLASRERLRRLDALCTAAGAGADALTADSADAPAAAQLLAGVGARLDGVAGADGRLGALAERARSLVIEARELGMELRDYSESAQAEAMAGGELAQVEERLEAIERLIRKHGGSIDGVLEHARHARERIAELAGAEASQEQDAARLERARVELDEHVRALRLARAKAASRLARDVRRQLGSLAMAEASFDVVLSEREPGPSGADGVEFMIAPNPGVAAGPLREIASGGELSRIMLALMSAAAGPSTVGTLVFDEVDAGISGKVARAVGARLKELAGRRQVLCITHLPQIASLADRHFRVVKDTSARPTRAAVVQLAEGDVVSELVRMLGADDDDRGALRHARELRRAA